jgi:hypothetical protein
MAQSPLSIEEHRDLAQELRLTDARLHELSELIAGVYGTDSRVAFMFRRAADSVSRLREEMQTQAVLDLEGEAGQPTYV